MADLMDFVQPVAVGVRVSELTGKSADGFSASGFSAFVQAVTGKVPAVVQLPGKRAKITLSPEQVRLMQKWLDGQVSILLAKPKEQSLQFDMNPVVLPWAMKYLVPACVLFVVAGWLARHYLGGR